MTMIASKTSLVKFERKTRFISYPAGRYDPNTSYVCTESAGPFIEQDGQYYAMSKVGEWLGASVGRTPKEDYAMYGNKATWILMDKYKAVILEMLFADYAKLGSAVFLGDYMFSQYGIDSNSQDTESYHNFNPGMLGEEDCPFTPNLYIDWFKGYIEAMDGKFKGDIIAKRLYVPFTRYTPDDLPLIWNFNEHSTNISIVGSEQQLEAPTLILPASKNFPGITLRIFMDYTSLLEKPVYLSTVYGDHFKRLDGEYGFYQLPILQFTEVTSVLVGNGNYTWVILNPISENFLNF